MTVPPRQPYAGELVFTAFSGSHQDAIKKGLHEWEDRWNHLPASQPYETPVPQYWDVPYLAIDPADIGREYREVIRVNSQSGKGGVAYLLESEFGIALPKDMQREFGPIANDAVDRLGREVSGAELKEMFEREYIKKDRPWHLGDFRTLDENRRVKWEGTLFRDQYQFVISGEGNGPLSAFVHGLSKEEAIPRFEIAAYNEHALSAGEEAAAIAYIQIKTTDGKVRWGAGVDTNIASASVRALLSALNRL
jgi:2-isopropylmalate synthase